MGLFVLQCKHREGDSSNPGNLIESPSAFNLIFWQKTGYYISLSSLGHRGSEKSKTFFFGLPVTANYQLPLFHGVPTQSIRDSTLGSKLSQLAPYFRLIEIKVI